MRILLLFQFREGVELEFPVVEHWKSIQKMQIEMSFKAWLWLVHAKNMGGKCIWDYSNSTKANPSWYYRIVQGILSWGWVKGRDELKHQYFSWLIRKCSKIELHFIVWTTFKARGDVILTKYWEGEKRYVQKKDIRFQPQKYIKSISDNLHSLDIKGQLQNVQEKEKKIFMTFS